jgi:hypothetical protein
MLKENINIVQVFQKTRFDVLNANIGQSPVEESKLISDFYLKKKVISKKDITQKIELIP